MLQNTTQAQRTRFYRDLEDLLSPGFLSHKVRVKNTVFGLRSLGPGDLFLLRSRTDGDLGLEWQRWAVATSIWMVNGYNLLGERGITPRIYQSLVHLPKGTIDLLFSVLLGLWLRAQRAEEGIEAYNYEVSSRNLWRMMGGTPTNLLRGVQGVETLGLNLIQQVWVAFNEMEDQKIAFEQQWAGFKLVASSNSPKGIKKIDQRDQQLASDEKNRRQAVMDRYFYYRLGLVDREGFVKDRNRDLVGSHVGGTKTVEQLEQEMQRWVAGDYDQHDRIVEEYKQRILARQDAILREREERAQKLREESERRQDADLMPMPLVGYTQDQMVAILAGRGHGLPGARFVGDDEYARSKQYLDRHIQTQTSAGNLQVQGGRIVDPQAHPDADARTLQTLVQGRQVQIGDQPQQEAPRRPGGPKPEHVSQAEWDEYGGQVDPTVFGGGPRRRD